MARIMSYTYDFEAHKNLSITSKVSYSMDTPVFHANFHGIPHRKVKTRKVILKFKIKVLIKLNEKFLNHHVTTKFNFIFVTQLFGPIRTSKNFHPIRSDFLPHILSTNQKAKKIKMIQPIKMTISMCISRITAYATFQIINSYFMEKLFSQK